ncbi:MAG TPA: FAD-dependent oxidoreductase, partial [Candidatus Dormibacteraeota bacterium]
MTAQRDAAWERLGNGRFDLLVIGAGIIGSRIAYEAARAGLRVALVDAGDFGGATSSGSTKLIHGGFRYLPMGDLGLVWESQRERAS